MVWIAFSCVRRLENARNGLIAITMSGLALLRGPAVFLSWFRHDISQTSDPLFLLDVLCTQYIPWGYTQLSRPLPRQSLGRCACMKAMLAARVKQRGAKGAGEERHLLDDTEAADSPWDAQTQEQFGWRGVNALPLLPTPRHCERNSEACCGLMVVVALICMFVGIAQTLAWRSKVVWTWICLALVYVDALIAIGCWCGITFGDNGTIKRSPSTCFPVPPAVKERIKANRTMDGLRNIRDAPDEPVYCVRCFVWRPAFVECHHCDACQRCVVDFDHHCGVFGRCIAGEGFAGNMGFFKTIIGCAVAAGVACMLTMFFSTANVGTVAKEPLNAIVWHAVKRAGRTLFGEYNAIAGA